jgi:hypothetical protein
MARVAYLGKRHMLAIPLTLHNNVCLGKSPNGGRPQKSSMVLDK